MLKIRRKNCADQSWIPLQLNPRSATELFTKTRNICQNSSCSLTVYGEIIIWHGVWLILLLLLQRFLNTNSPGIVDHKQAMNHFEFLLQHGSKIFTKKGGILQNYAGQKLPSPVFDATSGDNKLCCEQKTSLATHSRTHRLGVRD